MSRLSWQFELALAFPIALEGEASDGLAPDAPRAALAALVVRRYGGVSAGAQLWVFNSLSKVVHGVSAPTGGRPVSQPAARCQGLDALRRYWGSFACKRRCRPSV